MFGVKFSGGQNLWVVKIFEGQNFWGSKFVGVQKFLGLNKFVGQNYVEMKIISYKKYPVYCYLEYNWCYNIASSLIYLVS